jgi:predicted nicotinamide N-methyase
VAETEAEPSMTSRSQDELSAFIQSRTALVAPPGCPEVRLHLATAMTSLWQDTEAFMPGVTIPPPYWALAWAGSQALARHLIDNPWLVRGRKVLDFAAGSGIAGIAAAKFGAATVEAYDSDPLARAAVALNAQSNGVIITTVTEDPGKDNRTVSPWEAVLVGDLGYEIAAVQQYLPWLRKLGAQGVLVLLADPGGVYGEGKGMVPLADYEIAIADVSDTGRISTRNATIYRIAG